MSWKTSSLCLKLIKQHRWIHLKIVEHSVKLYSGATAGMRNGLIISLTTYVLMDVRKNGDGQTVVPHSLISLSGSGLRKIA